MIIGVISDTHGLMREEALRELEGVEMILHAGDVGRSEVLDALCAVAPVVAIRGNVDVGAWAMALAEETRVEAGGAVIYMLHDVKQLSIDPLAAGVDVVISGHSHMPSIERRNGTLFLNPGSAGPRRFTLPISLARLTIDGAIVDAELIELD